MSGWRPALRIARRSVRRNLGRSILIAMLIAVPIAGATVVDGLLRTMTGVESNVYGAMGTADGVAEVTDQSALPDDWRPGYSAQEPVAGGDSTQAPTQASTQASTRDPAKVDLAALLPEGSRVVRDVRYDALRLTEGDRIVRTQLNTLDIGDPLTEHRARLVSGQPPDGPREALVTEPLAERLGLLDGGDLRPGATLTARNGPKVTVTGLATDPRALSRQIVVAPRDSVLVPEPTSSTPDEMVPSFRYFVDLPKGTSTSAVWPTLAAHGVTLEPRDMYTNPERYPGSFGQSAQDEMLATGGSVALVVGIGMLEVVLLAGAAFAVGARRQVRELGLIGANGGTTKHVRRTVLAQGLLLGVLGAVAGIAFGMLVTVLAEPLWEQLTGQLIDGWRFGWPELALAGGVGLLSGLAAALLPAIGVARLRPVDALAQRFRSTALRTRPSVLGMLLLGVGIAGTIASGLLGRAVMTDYLARLEEASPHDYFQPDMALPTVGVLLGTLAAVVGTIMITSGLLGGLARLAGRLPLSGRLAMRDAGRHRHRTVPAIAAIMIVVTGSVALAFTFAATATEDHQSQPDNTVIVEGDTEAAAQGGTAAKQAKADLADAGRDVAAQLPGATVLESTFIADPAHESTLVSLKFADDARGRCFSGSNNVGIATPELIAMATGQQPDSRMLAALDEGKAVVFNDCLVSAEGTARTSLYKQEAEETVLPAYLAERETESGYSLPGAFVSVATAKANGWQPSVRAMVVSYAPSATQDDVDAALTAAEDDGLTAIIETDDSEEINAATLGVAAGAGLITLLGVSITVALSGAESRADLATLAAIGAPPRRRRTLAGAQALVISGVGTVLGVVVGGVLGYTVVPLIHQTTVAVPWQHLGITAVAVPLLAVIVATLTTRANLPMVRRVE